MKENNILENLKQDIIIPENVQKKAENAFAQVREEANAMNSRKKIISFSGIKNIGFRKRKMAAAVFAAFFCAGAVTVSAAAYHMWSQSLKNELNVTSEQEKNLKDSTLSDNPMQTATDAGVTITSVQSIVDNRYAYLAFDVDGYDFSTDEEFAFESVNATINGKAANIYGAGFKGSEYYMVISLSEKADSIIGKEVCVQLSNLEAGEKADAKTTVDGNWELTWMLQGSEDMKAYNFSETLGDSGATLTKAEISPISLAVTYTMPRTTTLETYTDKVYSEENPNGTVETHTEEVYVDPPMLVGVRMKDGSLYTDLLNGGLTGYIDDTSDTYVTSMAMNRILDVDEVDALLFLKDKSVVDSEQELTENNLYIVPVQ